MKCVPKFVPSRSGRDEMRPVSLDRSFPDRDGMGFVSPENFRDGTRRACLVPFETGRQHHRKRIIVAVYRRAKPYKIMSDCFFNTRKIRNARLILNRTNQSIFCTSSAPMSVSSALFCTAAIPNVTDIAMHILCASRRTCSTTYSLAALTISKFPHNHGEGRWLPASYCFQKVFNFLSLWSKLFGYMRLKRSLFTFQLHLQISTVLCFFLKVKILCATSCSLSTKLTRLKTLRLSLSLLCNKIISNWKLWKPIGCESLL